MRGFRLLKLNDGTECIGTKGNDNRLTWSVIYTNGSVGAVNDNKVVSVHTIRKGKETKRG